MIRPHTNWCGGLLAFFAVFTYIVKKIRGGNCVGKAVIWDLDGTLLDSYGVIVESLQLTMQEHGIMVAYDEVWQHTIRYSVSSFLEQMSAKYKLPVELLKQHYSQISGDKYHDIVCMKNALEVLQQLQESGVEHYVFTHRGKTTIPVLYHLGLAGFFREVITSQSGFARKPAPDAINYLVAKYGLRKCDTYYVGDRSLDMQCARNAGISGILFLDEKTPGVPTGEETYLVRDLMKILQIL